MENDRILVLVGAMFYFTFLLTKMSFGLTVFGLLLVVIGFLNYAVNHKTTNLVFPIPLVYAIGLVLAYIQYKPDTFTMGISLTILVIISIVSLYLQRKQINVD